MLNFDIKKNKCFFCEKIVHYKKNLNISTNQCTKLKIIWFNVFLKIIIVMNAHCQKNSMIEKTMKQNRNNFPLYIVALVYNFYNIFYTFFLNSPLWCTFCLFSDNVTENLLVCPWTLTGAFSQHFQENCWVKGYVCTFCWWSLPNFLPEMYYSNL